MLPRRDSCSSQRTGLPPVSACHVADPSAVSSARTASQSVHQRGEQAFVLFGVGRREGDAAVACQDIEGCRIVQDIPFGEAASRSLVRAARILARLCHGGPERAGVATTLLTPRPHSASGTSRHTAPADEATGDGGPSTGPGSQRPRFLRGVVTNEDKAPPRRPRFLPRPGRLARPRFGVIGGAPFPMGRGLRDDGLVPAHRVRPLVGHERFSRRPSPSRRARRCPWTSSTGCRWVTGASLRVSPAIPPVVRTAGDRSARRCD